MALVHVVRTLTLLEPKAELPMSVGHYPGTHRVMPILKQNIINNRSNIGNYIKIKNNGACLYQLLDV